MKPDRKLLYFGCIGQPGHYLFKSGESTARDWEIELQFPNCNPHLLSRNGAMFDGTFTPVEGKNEAAAGHYQESIIPPIRIVAWWDCTGDERSNSNSALIGIGYDSAEEMLDDALNHFPTVMKRQPRPVPHKPA